MTGDRVLVAVDPAIDVAPVELVARWEADDEARELGAAELEPVSGRVFVPGLVELVAIPLVVNVASSALCALVKRLVAGRSGEDESTGLDVVEVQLRDGDRVIVVRGTRAAR